MLKKIFTGLFSFDAAQPEPTTHTASASLSADALRDLECRKRAIVADITRLAAELAACPDLGAPVGGLANPAAAASNPTSATATSSTLEGRLAEAAEWLGQGEPRTSNAALTRGSLASANFAARPSSALSPTWAETSRAYNEGLDRAAPVGVGTLAGVPALARANLAAANPVGGPYPRPAILAEAAEYFAARERGAK